MTIHLQTTAATQTELLVYLKHHRIWTVETLLWKWLTAHPMTADDSLQSIRQLKIWLDAFRPLPSTVVNELQQRYRVRFTYHSNALEGNTLTQSETEMVLTTGITVGGKTLQEHLEVVGHADAIAYIETLAQQNTPLEEWEIRQIHSLILRKINPEEAGRYRTLDVQASGTGYVYPPHYLLPELMAEFIAWLNSMDVQALHPVRYAAEAHHRFVTIHPFRDGNGRTARLLMNLLLLRAGYPIAIISNEYRQRYIEALIQEQQSDNWDSFYTLIIDATQTALVEVLAVLATAGEIQNKELPFYQELLEFLQQQES